MLRSATVDDIRELEDLLRETELMPVEMDEALVLRYLIFLLPLFMPLVCILMYFDGRRERSPILNRHPPDWRTCRSYKKKLSSRKMSW